MTKDLTTTTVSPFDTIRQQENGQEYWSARDLQKLMGYAQWRQFEDAVERAMIACKNSSFDPESNFAEVRKVTGKGHHGSYTVKDYRLTRYACYLVAMNSDPRKEAVSQAQTYFAQQTRKAELAPAAPSSQPQINSLWQDRLERFHRETRLPSGYWCIFGMVAGYCYGDEFRGVHLQEDAVPDISVGLLWMKEVRRLGLDEQRIQKYPHHYPDRRGVQPANIYPNEWLGAFWSWFHAHYLPHNYPLYLQTHTQAEPARQLQGTQPTSLRVANP